MLSGIGPAEQLAPLGIPVLLDQPLVGQNLQDHPPIRLVFTHSQPVSLLARPSSPSTAALMAEGRGPLASNGPRGRRLRAHAATT